MYKYGWIPLLSTGSYHNIVNQLYFNTKLKKIKKEYQIAFTWIKQKCLFIVLSKENSPTLNQNMVQRNLDHLDILQNFTMTHFTNTILFSGPNEQKMVNIQKVLVRGMCPIGYGPSENASTWYICKIFRVQWLRTYWHIPFKIRGSTTKKKRRITAKIQTNL